MTKNVFCHYRLIFDYPQFRWIYENEAGPQTEVRAASGQPREEADFFEGIEIPPDWTFPRKADALSEKARHKGDRRIDDEQSRTEALRPPDRYEKNWPSPDHWKDYQLPGDGGYKAGKAYPVLGEKVWVRGGDGRRDQLVGSPLMVTVADPLERIAVEKTNFIRIIFQGAPRFIAETYLPPHPKNRPTARRGVSKAPSASPFDLLVSLPELGDIKRAARTLSSALAYVKKWGENHPDPIITDTIPSIIDLLERAPSAKQRAVILANFQNVLTQASKPEWIEQKLAAEKEKAGVAMREYLSGNPALERYYTNLRAHWTKELTSLESRAQGSGSIGQLNRYFLDHFDSIMFTLFKGVDLKQNQKILLGRSFPRLMFTGEIYQGQVLTLPPDKGAQAILQQNPPLIVINRTLTGVDLKTFAQAFVHELTHAHFEHRGTMSYARSIVGEGFTQMLAEEATGYSSDSIGYNDEVAIAKRLTQAAPLATKAWYAGSITDPAYENHLKSAQGLEATYTQNIFALSAELNKAYAELDTTLDLNLNSQSSRDAGSDNRIDRLRAVARKYIQQHEHDPEEASAADSRLIAALQSILPDASLNRTRVDLYNEIWKIKNRLSIHKEKIQRDLLAAL